MTYLDQESLFRFGEALRSKQVGYAIISGVKEAIIITIFKDFKVKKEPITEYGYNKLASELNDLKNNQRPQTVVEIDIARSHGDLKENAEYHAAKEKLAFIEARIAELSDLLSRVQVIDPSKLTHDKIMFGSTVKLEDIDVEEEIVYTIVGAYESNPEHGLISFNSPLAKQLLGKKQGDEVTVKLPMGEQDFEILEVGFKEISFE